MATTARISVAPALHSETKLDVQHKIKELHGWHEIPEELIINFDQTPLMFALQVILIMKKAFNFCSSPSHQQKRVNK